MAHIIHQARTRELNVCTTATFTAVSGWRKSRKPAIVARNSRKKTMPNSTTVAVSRSQ